MNTSTPSSTDAEPTHAGTPRVPASPPPSDDAKPRHRRRWPWVLLILLGLILAAAALAPMILTSSPVRGMILSRINAGLNGRIEVGELTAGWFSPMAIGQVRAYDDQNRLIFEMKRLSSALTLWDAVRGEYDLGKTRVDELNLVDLHVYKDGSTNYQRLAKGWGKSAEKPAKSTPKDQRPSRLPDISGQVAVKGFRATITADQAAEPLLIDSSDATLDIPSINEPIANRISIQFRAGESVPASTLSIDGEMKLATNNLLDLEHLAGKQTLKIDGVSLAPTMALTALASSPSLEAESSPTSRTGVDKPTSPLKVLSGAMSAELMLAAENGTVRLDAPSLALSNLSIQRGGATYAFARPVSLQLGAVARANPGAAGASPLEQIASIEMTRLSGDAGAVTFAMAEPIVVRQPAGLLAASPGAPSAQVAGSINFNGELAEVSKLLAALGGSPAEQAMPIAGTFGATQAVALRGREISISGDFRVPKLVITADKSRRFEDNLQLVNDVGWNLDSGDADIRKLDASLRASGAGAISIRGAIRDVLHERRFDPIELTLAYHLEKLWDLARPLLSEEQQKRFKDLKVTGQAQRQFVITGRYPSDKPLGEALTALVVAGDFYVETFDYQGASVRRFTVPIWLKDGTLRTAYADPQKTLEPAWCNDGLLRIGGIATDLTRPSPRISIPAGQMIAENVALNPVLAESVLVYLLNNPAFVDPKQATGLFSLQCVRCEDLPVQWFTAADNKKPLVSGGSAEFGYSITRLTLGNKLLGTLLGANAVNAEIRQAKLTIADGVARTHIPLTIDSKTAEFDGSVALANRYVDMNLAYPKELIPKALLERVNILQRLPAYIQVPLNGPMGKLKPDLLGAVTKSAFGSIPDNPADLIDAITGKKKSSPAPGTGPDDKTKPDNPVGDLLDLFDKKKPKK